jgi:hypothetical protein
MPREGRPSKRLSDAPENQDLTVRGDRGFIRFYGMLTSRRVESLPAPSRNAATSRANLA